MLNISYLFSILSKWWRFHFDKKGMIFSIIQMSLLEPVPTSVLRLYWGTFVEVRFWTKIPCFCDQRWKETFSSTFRRDALCFTCGALPLDAFAVLTFNWLGIACYWSYLPPGFVVPLLIILLERILSTQRKDRLQTSSSDDTPLHQHQHELAGVFRLKSSDYSDYYSPEIPITTG